MDGLNKKEVRFKQRFANFEKAYRQFCSAVERDTASDEILRAGLIQTFEYTFELAWKTLKDKLEAHGVVVSTPRDVIREALQAGMIVDGKTWLDALDKRNEMSHMYDEKLTREADQKIRSEYAPILATVNEYFKKQL